MKGFAALLLLPAGIGLILVVLAASQPGPSVDLPPEALSATALVAVVTNAVWRAAAIDTLLITLLATALALVAGTAAALVLHGLSSRYRTALLTILLLPALLPAILLAVGWYPAFQYFGLYDRPLGVALLHGMLAAPLVALPVLGGLQRLGLGIWQSAASLGVKPIDCALRLVLPALKLELGIGLVLSALFSFNEVAIALFLTALDTQPLVQLLWTGVRFEYSPEVFAGAVWLLLVEGMLLFGLISLRKSHVKRIR